MNTNEIVKKNRRLLTEIAKIGKHYFVTPSLRDLFPFEHYFRNKGYFKRSELDKNDGIWTRREILCRYLFLSAVLDQGPDIDGVRLLAKEVVNALYKKEIRILHKPLDFFGELGISIDEILGKHANIKGMRANEWARQNKSNPNRYNLFTDRTNQVLGFAIYRWGVPLCVPLLLEKDFQKKGIESFEPLVDYIEKWDSAEIMSRQIKDHERYGLGKAIGDKAGHLFAKSYIHVFRLVRKKSNSWGVLSYELPLDSNVGRVLFRTGFLLSCADLSEYEDWEVIQKGKGKGRKHYIRVTNIRGRKSDKFSNLDDLMDSYKTICAEYLKVKQRPSKIEIQHIPNTLLFGTEYGIGNLDDGLMHIGTRYCLNHDEPRCGRCPIKELCVGHKTKSHLIVDYRT